MKATWGGFYDRLVSGLDYKVDLIVMRELFYLDLKCIRKCWIIYFYLAWNYFAFFFVESRIVCGNGSVVSLQSLYFLLPSFLGRSTSDYMMAISGKLGKWQFCLFWVSRAICSGLTLSAKISNEMLNRSGNTLYFACVGVLISRGMMLQH